MDENNKLPDDLSQWPDDNWELFGLDSNASYDELRKAYSKLIKLFRPETRPDHFQRIQRAFETLRDLIQSKENGNPNERQNADSENNEEIQSRRSKRQKAFLSALYNQYIYKADWDGARKFLENAIEQAQSEEKTDEFSDLDELPYLYMFWLQYALCPPDKDVFPDIIKYLIMGENAHQDEDMSLSIKTLFFFLERKELSHKDSIYDYTMSHLDFPAILLLVNIRWLNLRFEEEFDDVDVILSDLETLKKRFKSQNPKAWIRINIEAIEHLLWVKSPKTQKAIGDCIEEITQFPEYSDYYDEKLDSLDRLEETIESVKKIPDILPVNINLIHTILLMSGNTVFTRYRRLVLKFASELADDVLLAFMVFDYLNMYHPLVTSRLFSPLQQMFLSRHEKNELTQEQIDSIVKKLLQIWESHEHNYNACRLPYLKFFLEETLDPADVYDYMSNYYDTIKDDPSKTQEVENLKEWHSGYTNDGSIALTFYTVMSCELEGMEDFEEDD